MKLITVNLPEAYVNGIERLILEKLYPNRSEAIRIAVRDLLKKELWEPNIPQPKAR
ncbi:ribbon-helix-helix protein, CopG family [Candidatus Bathyarchaeota archaeon]|nr:ribbon-helix-helix protein, CopG family [Candidatus Bathyarchaeota archaeon]